jgi:hypothetical protein
LSIPPVFHFLFEERGVLMGWEVILLLFVGGFLYKLKSIHIEFRGKGDENDESKNFKQVKSTRRRKQLKK